MRKPISTKKGPAREPRNARLERSFTNATSDPSPRTRRENYVSRCIIRGRGALALQRLTGERIERQATEWNKRVSAVVVNRTLRTLTDIIREAKRHGAIRDNPAAEAQRLKEESDTVTPDKVLTKAELRAVIN